MLSWLAQLFAVRLCSAQICIMASSKFTHFAEAFCQFLNDLLPGWSISDGVIRGPEDAAIRFSEEHPSSSEAHVDVEFSFQDSTGVDVRLWDCVSGFGETVADWAETAAHIWSNTTALALLELKYSRRGEYADHFHGDEPQGLTGWHCICSSVLGYGVGESGQLLQDWWLQNHTVLPGLASALDDLTDSGPHGIKILFGANDIAEVRVDGHHHEKASEALRSLDWPRLPDPGFLRVYVIAMHRE